MVAAEEGEGGQQRLRHRLLGQLGEQDQQRPAAEPSEGRRERAPVVALDQLRLEGVHGLGDPSQLVAAGPGRHDRPHHLVEGDQAAPVAQAGGDRGQHHHRVHGVLEAGDVGHPARHHPPVVEQEEDGLVALGPVGAHDRAADPGGGGPVDPAELVVDACTPAAGRTRCRRPAPAPTAGRPRGCGPGRCAAPPPPRPERRVHPEHARHLEPALAGGQPPRPVDPQHDLGGRELPPPPGTDGRRGRWPVLPAGRPAAPAGTSRPSDGRQLVGQGQAQEPAGGRVAHRPPHLGLAPEGDDARQVPLDGDGRRPRRPGPVDHRRHQQGRVDDQKTAAGHGAASTTSDATAAATTNRHVGTGITPAPSNW